MHTVHLPYIQTFLIIFSSGTLINATNLGAVRLHCHDFGSRRSIEIKHLRVLCTCSCQETRRSSSPRATSGQEAQASLPRRRTLIHCLGYPLYLHLYQQLLPHQSLLHHPHPFHPLILHQLRISPLASCQRVL